MGKATKNTGNGTKLITGDDDLDEESWHQLSPIHETKSDQKKYAARQKEELAKLKKDLLQVKKGDEVYIQCVSSMGASSNGKRKVTKISVKFDEDTGKPYNVIHSNDSQFDSRNGAAVKEPLGYFISEIYLKEK